MILSNKAQCLNCNEIIESKHRHDLVICKCGDIYVDGGKDYLRRGFPANTLPEDAYLELSEVSELTTTTEVPE